MGQTDEVGKSNRALAWATIDDWRGQARGRARDRSVRENGVGDVSTIHTVISMDNMGAQTVVIIVENSGHLIDVEDCPKK